MKSFQTTAIVKHPPTPVVAIMRDRLPELAAHLGEIDSIACVERAPLADGGVLLVHRWQANIELPAAVRSAIGSDLAWLDRATWSADTMTCAWQIEPLFLDGGVDCRGSATYAAAMGGRGTRVTFQGCIDLDGALASGRIPGLGAMVANLVTFVVTSAVPKNLRKALDAAALLLDAEAAR